MIDRLRAMLDNDPSIVHSRGGDGQMPLHFARTVDIAELLLARGAGAFREFNPRRPQRLWREIAEDLARR